MNKKFLLFSFFATLILYIGLSLLYVSQIGNNSIIFYVNLSQVFVFYAVLFVASEKKLYSEYYLITLLLVVNFIYVILYNYLYYHYTGTYFGFILSDSFLYHTQSLIALKYSYLEGIIHFVKSTRFGYDDAGMIAYVSLLYRIIKDPLFPRFINVILNITTALIMFRMAKFFVKERTAFLIALIYGMASFTLYFVSMELKEPIFTLLVLVIYYSYLKYNLYKKKRYITYIIGFSLLLLMFRIPVALFALISISAVEVFKKGLTMRKLIVGIVVLGILSYVLMTNFLVVLKYITDQNLAVDYVAGSRSSLFIRATSILSGFMGPLPTVIPTLGKGKVSLYAGSLILKSFLSIYFIYSIYFIVKNRNYTLVAPLLMCLFTILGLISIEDTFKTRYVIPYMPLFLILCAYSYNKLKTNKGKNKFLRRSIIPVNVALFFVMIAWNILRLKK